MKKIIFATLALLSASFFATISLSSCSGDDGTDEITNKDEKEPVFGLPADNLPKDQDFFTGFWQTNTGPSSFIFYANGTCKGISNLKMASIGTGEWTYNATTNILSTTIQSSQYQVTLCNRTGTAWTGVQLGSNLAQTFYKGSTYYILAIIAGTEWTNGSNTIQFSGNFKNMEYANNIDKDPSYQYVKRLITVKQTGISATELNGIYNIKSYVNYDSSYRWIDEITSSITIENYMTSDPILHLGGDPSSEYHLAK